MERLIQAIRDSVLGGWTAKEVRDYFTPDMSQSPREIAQALKEAVKRGIIRDTERALFV